jgi:hypothetical protein
MGTYIVQSHQYAHKPADELDDGQAFHWTYTRGDELELDDEHHHTKTLVGQGVVISKKAAEKQQDAASSARELDGNVGYDQSANDSKSAETTKPTPPTTAKS